MLLVVNLKVGVKRKRGICVLQPNLGGNSSIVFGNILFDVLFGTIHFNTIMRAFH